MQNQQKQLLIQRFMAPNGRADYRALQEMADEKNEQQFVQMVRAHCLVGVQVLPGEISDDPNDSSATKLFDFCDDAGRDSSLKTFDLSKVVFPLAGGKNVAGDKIFSVGQDDANDITISDYSISRHHMVFRIDHAGRCFVKDLESKNSTMVRNEVCEPNVEVEILNEDPIQIGRYQFHFLSPGMLYARLKGLDIHQSIMELVNTLGKADYKALKKIASYRGEDVFVQLVRNPALVGVGLFKGQMVDPDSDEDENETRLFMPEDIKKQQAVAMKYLTRNIFPIIFQSEDLTDKAHLTIGRSENNDLCMADGSISRLHAQIRSAGEGHFYYKDYGSSNGSRINGKKVGEEEVVLSEGDKLKIGRFLFTFVFPSTLYRMLKNRR
jgi:pSer/pThr/pTyr-binding forkhead associated (FHA) protein